MQINTIKLPKAINPAYRKQKVLRAEIEVFKDQLRILLERINTDESEENAKQHLTAFLNNTYYQGEYLIATKGRADLVIHTAKKAKSNPGILLEMKRPQADGRASAEMMRVDKPNVKALHELILYFLRERVEHNNTDLKYLIVTDIHEWFIFDAADFEQLFFKNKNLLKDYKDWRDGRKTASSTDFFYQHIAQPFVDRITSDIDCTHFDLRHYKKIAENDDPKDDKYLIPLYKIFSPAHLLRLAFANDSNSLNKDFYYELLHLIGLAETKIKNKKVIQRKPADQRDAGSLLENAIRTLETEDRLRKVPHLTSYGNSREEQLFGVALELCITWINRILFLKLLEAQLLRYHPGNKNYRFLNIEKIKDYDELNELFFEVLAKEMDERAPYVTEKFAHIPYLNSSLFEISELEDVTIRINSMKDRFDLPLLSRTVLRDEKGKRQTGERRVLHYLFSFLDAYDFSSEGTESIQEENKSLINASVLGLIFEKINGYQDGAFFTPGFVTMYMCRETLRRAVVQKFIDSTYFADFVSEDFADLEHYLSRKYTAADQKQANQLINELKICDPAVGSGHFLVSALNELLTIKSELNILLDRQAKPLAVRLEVANDELITYWRQSDALFEYRPGVKDSQTVQEALFHEKQILIESCLFGVDLNPNSVKICRLRLWIELLKQAYYKNDQELETLPNIDINIKQGNSLVSRFALDADLRKALKGSKYSIHEYRGFVRDYHRATDKDEKRALQHLIDDVKKNFRSEIGRNDPKVRRLNRLGEQLFQKYETGQLFAQKLSAAQQKDKAKLEAQIHKLSTEIEAIKSAVIYRDAFEWRFEFPEVLDAEGAFVGFDVILGNPPYIRQEEFSDLKPYLQQNFATYAGTADLLVYFIERAYQVMRPKACFSFIISNKFMRAGFGRPLREWLKQRRLLEIIDFGDLPVFEEATTYPCILSWQKTVPQETFLAANVSELRKDDFDTYIPSIAFTSLQNALNPKGWTLADAATQQLLEKLQQKGTPLGEYVNGKIYYGIKTGFNEAFVIDGATRERLIAADPKSAEVIKPFLAGRDVKRYQQPVANKYLLFTRRGIDINAYPAIKTYLESYRERLEPRPKDWKGKSSDWPGRKPGTYKWYEIQDSVDYYKAFEKEKIIIPDIALRAQGLYDKSHAYCVNTAYIIPTKEQWLLSIINSRLVHFYYSNITSSVRGGYLRFIRQYMELIPIVLPLDSLKHKLEELVKQMIYSLDRSNHQIEDQIDLLVYKLYDLSWAEVKIIDPDFALSEEAYTRYQVET